MTQRYNLYAGPSKESIDYETPIAQVDHPTTQAVVVQAADTEVWYGLRAENDGGEEDNASVVVFCRVDAAGHLVGPVPNAVAALAAEARSGARVRLTWVYHAGGQETPPAEFRVYGDGGGGAVDYGTALGAVAYVDRVPSYEWVSGPLTDGQEYRFVVRAASAAGPEEQNTEAVAIVADASGPALHRNWLLEVQG